MVPIRRITKIAPVCKKYATTENFLIDMLFIETINVTPISVGRGETIRKPAKGREQIFSQRTGYPFLDELNDFFV